MNVIAIKHQEPSFMNFPTQIGEPSIDKVYTCAKHAFLEMRDKLWNFINPPWQIVRRSIHITAQVVPQFSTKLLRVFAGMGLTMCLNALLTLSKLPDTVKSLLKNLELNDIEGVITSCFSLLMNPLDILDSTMVFTKSLAALGVIPVISIFSMISLPVALVLLGYGTLKGTYDTYRIGMEMTKFPKQITSDSLENLHETLKDRLYGAKSIRHIHKLTRRTDQKVVNLMKDLLETQDVNLANQKLKILHSHLQEKFVIGCISNLATLGLGVTLAATYIFPVSAVTISAAILIKNAVTLGKSTYLELRVN